MITPASMLFATKNYYTPTRVETLTQKDFPLVAMLRKRTDLTSALPGGRAFVNVMIAGNGASGSTDFATAQNNSAFPPLAGFQLFSAKDYANPTIDAATIEATGDNKGAFFGVLKEAINAGLRESAQSQALNVIGDGTGVRGTVSAITGSTAVTLSDVAQNVNFQAATNGVGGTVLQFGYVSSGVWQLRNSGQQVMVTGLDPTTGIITVTVPSGSAVGDILVRAGDLPAGTPWNNGLGTTGGGRFAGLAGWCPLRKPQPGMNDSFGGFDRSANPYKFAGGRFSAVGKSATDGINLSLSAVRSQGGHPNILLVNEFTWGLIESDLEGRRSFDATPEKVASASGSIGFDSLRIRTPKGALNIVADNTMPSKIGYFLQLDCFTLWSMHGPHVRILDYPGYGIANVPSANSDSIQSRLGTRGTVLECSAPGFQLVTQFV